MESGFILLMFDIPDDGDHKRIYRHFKKELSEEGYYMLQKSIYFKQIRNIKLYKYNFNILKKHLDDDCNVKAIVMTQKQFEKIVVLSGKEIPIGQDIIVTI